MEPWYADFPQILCLRFNSLTLLGKEDQIAIACEEKVYIYEALSGQRVQTLEHPAFVTSITWQEGDICSGSKDKLVRVWKFW